MIYVEVKYIILIMVRFEFINNDIVMVIYLTVAVKGCPLPPLIAKGEYQILPWRTGNSSTIPFYSSAVYMCHRGYILHGSSYISCSPHGWWQPFTVPRCIPESGGFSGTLSFLLLLSNSCFNNFFSFFFLVFFKNWNL